MKKTLLALLLALPVFGQTITSIDPPVGLIYTTTKVIITGTGFSHSDLNCLEAPGLCPAKVIFVVPVNGTPVEIQGTVVAVSETHIEVLAPPRPHGTVAEVKVRVTNSGEAVKKNGFRWDETALPEPADRVQYLLPITLRNLPGANGSLWTSEWTVRNPWQTALLMVFNGDMVIPAESLVRPVVQTRLFGLDGAYVYLPRQLAGSIGMSLRVRDLSRNAQSFGTEIPIVPRSDYSGNPQLLDIPTNPKYRATLRIYGPGPHPQLVQVRVLSEAGALIEEHWIDTVGADPGATITLPLFPSYAQLDPLTDRVRASGERVHIALVSQMWGSGISPPPAVPIWAFVTVTDNETQQVTTVTPQP